jgi:hypothetical protein
MPGLDLFSSKKDDVALIACSAVSVIWAIVSSAVASVSVDCSEHDISTKPAEDRAKAFKNIFGVTDIKNSMFSVFS